MKAALDLKLFGARLIDSKSEIHWNLGVAKVKKKKDWGNCLPFWAGKWPSCYLLSWQCFREYVIWKLYWGLLEFSKQNKIL